MSACRLCEDKRHARALIEAYYRSARRSIRLARAYAAEPGTSGRRERESLDHADHMRRAASEMRAKLRGYAACMVEHGEAA